MSVCASLHDNKQIYKKSYLNTVNSPVSALVKVRLWSETLPDATITVTELHSSTNCSQRNHAVL